MSWKVGAPLLVLVAGVLFSRMNRVGAPKDPIRRTEVIAATAPPLVEGVRDFRIAEPAAREVRRNLFAFPEVRQPERPRVVPTTRAPQTAETPSVEEKREPLVQREPEFPMRFIGTFGFDRDRIAVFKSNDEVVNAKVGDVVTGEFRLAAIGIESVEVSTPRGTTQRVALLR